jgi:hypothetical protein
MLSMLNFCMTVEEDYKPPEKNYTLSTISQNRIEIPGNMLNPEGALSESGWANKNLKKVNIPYFTGTSWSWVKKPACLRYKQFFNQVIYSGDWYIRIGGYHYGYFGRVIIDLINVKTREFGFDDSWTSMWQSYPFKEDKMPTAVNFKNSGMEIRITQDLKKKEIYMKIKSKILKLSGELIFGIDPIRAGDGHLHLEPADDDHKFWTKVWTQANQSVKGKLEFDGRYITINSVNKSMFSMTHIKSFWKSDSSFFEASGALELEAGKRIYVRFAEYPSETNFSKS